MAIYQIGVRGVGIPAEGSSKTDGLGRIDSTTLACREFRGLLAMKGSYRFV
jgi:hypothetical protein